VHLQVRGRGRRPRPGLIPRLGLLGGSFNPPHVGHLGLARAALAGLRLDRVDLLPVFVPPHKAIAADPGADVRLALCRLAARDEPGVDVCDLEVRRGGVSYTVDTLRALDGSDELTFIVGGDMALSLPSWREPEEILRLARLGVADRGDADRPAIERALAGYDGARVDWFAMPRIDVSSTDVRAACAAGRSLAGLVPDAVSEEIERRGLYR
jgi:nicotinate-nucleotide adenylyltransferase